MRGNASRLRHERSTLEPKAVSAVRARRPQARPRPQTDRPHVSLLDGFELRLGGGWVSLPLPAQRLVALLALRRRPLRRLHVAGLLWLDSSEARASGSLRSALWQVRRSGCHLVEEIEQRLRLAPAVRVDVREVEAWVDRVSDPSSAIGEADVAAASTAGELLPDWYDEWVGLERERLRQRRAHALETLCRRLAGEKRFPEAIDVGLAAVAHEPFRESAHRALISAHLAEGNRADAARQYGHCRRLLEDELGLTPSALMTELVGPQVLRRSENA